MSKLFSVSILYVRFNNFILFIQSKLHIILLYNFRSVSWRNWCIGLCQYESMLCLWPNCTIESRHRNTVNTSMPHYSSGKSKQICFFIELYPFIIKIKSVPISFYID